MTKPSARGRVLVIDDQAPTRYIFRRILTGAGFEVEEAGTGADGLTKAMTLPDLIIADVNLPDMLGYDICRRLRSNPLTVSIPVLQISASFVSDESRVQALEGGADSYLTQPVEPAVLIAQVNALLRLRRAEALSNLSARQWQSTFDALSDGLALLDAEGILVRVNRTFLDLLGFTASEAEGQHVSELFESRFNLSFSDFVEKGGKSNAIELLWRSRWFRVRVDKIQSYPESETGSVLLIADVTHHRKLQETLKLSERLANTGRLAHIIAHEINNPLEALSNLVYLSLRETSPGSDSHNYLVQASDELSRISQITKQLLAYHRETKKPVLSVAGELLEGVLTMFRSHILGSRVVLHAQTGCTQRIKVNPGEVRQVFGNLISNALDAIGPGGGQLRVKCTAAVDYRTQVKGVRFLFSDTGSGIAAPDYPRIFEAFYTTKDLQGSGVGLWLSAEVVEKHKGTIRVRTRTEGPYRGTLFDVFLPASTE